MPAISVEKVSKDYRIRYGKEPTLKGAVFDWVLRRKHYRSFSALKDISFTVNKGETLSVIGENGSGKSTLLGLLAGITRPTDGRIGVEGNISTLLELGAGFHGDLTGRENIYLYASILGLTAREVDKRIDRMIDFSELKEFIDSPVKYYSSGMYVRLGFTVAVEVDPDVLLVDEVLAVGDEYFQKKCFQRIKDFQARGKTLLFVSHGLNIVEEISDRVILLEKGRIADEGVPWEVVSEYRRRVLVKEEVIEVKEWGTRKVEITGVRFFDKEGRETRKFVSWEPMEIEIDYRAHEHIESPIFGLAIYAADGLNCFGTNSQMGGYRIPYVEGEGIIRIRIEKLTLSQGTFHFNFSIHSWDHREQFYRVDFLHDVEVRNLRGPHGFLELDCTWETADGSQGSRS